MHGLRNEVRFCNSGSPGLHASEQERHPPELCIPATWSAKTTQSHVGRRPWARSIGIAIFRGPDVVSVKRSRCEAEADKTIREKQACLVLGFRV